MQIRHLCYELYKIDWKYAHGITPDVESKTIIDYYEGLVDDDEFYTYEDYLDEFGYDGVLYVRYHEFLDYEYRDREYMYTLLKKKRPELLDIYDKDVEGLL